MDQMRVSGPARMQGHFTRLCFSSRILLVFISPPFLVASAKGFCFYESHVYHESHVYQLRLGLCLISLFGSGFSGFPLFTEEGLCWHSVYPPTRLLRPYFLSWFYYPNWYIYQILDVIVGNHSSWRCPPKTLPFLLDVYSTLVKLNTIRHLCLLHSF